MPWRSGWPFGSRGAADLDWPATGATDTANIAQAAARPAARLRRRPFICTSPCGDPERVALPIAGIRLAVATVNGMGAAFRFGGQGPARLGQLRHRARPR